jgi:hypothetical protein
MLHRARNLIAMCVQARQSLQPPACKTGPNTVRFLPHHHRCEVAENTVEGAGLQPCKTYVGTAVLHIAMARCDDHEMVRHT